MLGTRKTQGDLFRADHLHLDFVGRTSFYGWLALNGPTDFKDSLFADFYAPGGRTSIPPSQLLVLTILQGWGGTPSCCPAGPVRSPSRLAERQSPASTFQPPPRRTRRRPPRQSRPAARRRSCRARRPGTTRQHFHGPRTGRRRSPARRRAEIEVKMQRRPEASSRREARPGGRGATAPTSSSWAPAETIAWC